MTIQFTKIGDYYEAFGESARLVAKELGLTLTKSRTGEPMTGIPYYAIYRDAAELRSRGHVVDGVPA